MFHFHIIITTYSVFLYLHNRFWAEIIKQEEYQAKSRTEDVYCIFHKNCQTNCNTIVQKGIKKFLWIPPPPYKVTITVSTAINFIFADITMYSIYHFITLQKNNNLMICTHACIVHHTFTSEYLICNLQTLFFCLIWSDAWCISDNFKTFKTKFARNT